MKMNTISIVVLLMASAALHCPVIDSATHAADAKAPQVRRGGKKAKPARRVNLVYQQVEEVDGLPRVLLIGDSISIGYTLPVRKLLADEANAQRAPTNCGPTTKGLAELDSWIGDQKWDVIHFNWGLHDLKYLGPNGENLADPQGVENHQQVPPQAYEKNLRALVAQLKKTGAELIWCSTTPVPKGAKGRVVGDSARYNAIAARVMKENGITTNDLYAAAKPRLAEIQRPRDVHFTPAGSQQLAAQVATAIRAAVASRSKQ